MYEVEYIELPPPPHWKKKKKAGSEKEKEEEDDEFWKTAALFEEVHSLTDYRDTGAAAAARARAQQRRAPGSSSFFLTQQQQQQSFDDHVAIGTIDEEGEGGVWGQQEGLRSTMDDDDDLGMDAAAYQLDYGSICNSESFMQGDSLEITADAALEEVPPVSTEIRVVDDDDESAETAAKEQSGRTTGSRPPIFPQPSAGALSSAAARERMEDADTAGTSNSVEKRKPVKGSDSSRSSSSYVQSSQESNSVGSSSRSSAMDPSRKSNKKQPQQQQHSINWFIRQYTSSTPTYESALTRSSRSGGIGGSKAAASVGIALSGTSHCDNGSFSSSGDSLPSLPSISIIRKEAAGQSSAASQKRLHQLVTEQDAGQSAVGGPMIMSGSKVPEQIMSGSKVPEQIMSGSKFPEQIMSGSKVPEQIMSGSKVPEQIIFGSKVTDHDVDEESTSHLSISSNGSSFVSFNNSSAGVSDAQAEEKARYAEMVRYYDREENKRSTEDTAAMTILHT